MLAQLHEQGFVLREAVVAEAHRERLLSACDPARVPDSVRYRSGAAFAARALLEVVPELSALLLESGMTEVARSVLGDSAFPIDALFFDKRPDANWTVPGHQDRWMPIEEQVPEARMRDGVPCVRPSADVLGTLLALRLHFDSCGESSGALEVVPGSHCLGVVPDRALAEVGLDRYRTCQAAPGDVLLMRPLVLHRSSPSQEAQHRRVLHVVYAAEQPRAGYRWRVSA
jgi:hypothetical protein